MTALVCAFITVGILSSLAVFLVLRYGDDDDRLDITDKCSG